mgnify:CR=1 FL=1
MHFVNLIIINFTDLSVLHGLNIWQATFVSANRWTTRPRMCNSWITTFWFCLGIIFCEGRGWRILFCCWGWKLCWMCCWTPLFDWIGWWNALFWPFCGRNEFCVCPPTFWLHESTVETSIANINTFVSWFNRLILKLCVLKIDLESQLDKVFQREKISFRQSLYSYAWHILWHKLYRVTFQ